MRIKQLHHVMGLTMSQHRGKQVKRQVARFEICQSSLPEKKNKAHLLSDFDQ